MTTTARARRAAAALALALAGATLAAGGGRALAYSVNDGGDGGCAWTAASRTGPVNEGCSYVAGGTLGEIAWSGSTDIPSVSGATSAPACLLRGTAGECTYAQAVGAVIDVSSTGSAAGIAGVPQTGPLSLFAGMCTWSPPESGCTLTTPFVQGDGVVAFSSDVVLLTWAVGPAPQITVAGANAEVACTPTIGGGACEVTLSTTSAGNATVTIVAASGSIGAAGVVPDPAPEAICSLCPAI